MSCIIEVMKQMNQDNTCFECKTKMTRKREFLDEMSLVVSWSELVALVNPHTLAGGAKGDRPLVCHGKHAEHLVSSTVVQPVGPGDGRCALQHSNISRVFESRHGRRSST